ncbi:hypothetical protein EV424DRAFT_1548317 [Suillus variegatus]|nr:hypothetical protein EV424DRAFT_1548317 [Suillus variegatus]
MTSSTPPSGRPVRTRDQIIAENAAITARNEARREHRDRGENAVDNDEPLLPIPAAAPVIFANSNANRPSTSNATASSSQTGGRSSTPQPTTPNVSAMMAAFANLSPSKLATLHASIFNTTPAPSTSTPPASINNVTPTTSITAPSISSTSMPASIPISNTSPTLLFDVNNEHMSSSSISDTYSVHTYIIELAKSHQHIPLSILTMKATSCLFLEPSTLKFLTHYTSHRNSAPTKCHILDVSQFPAETSISIGEWHEVWARFLKLLADHASPQILERWTKHHNELQQHPDFEGHWSAILAFDIEQRASYIADPQPLDEAKYHRQFKSIKTRVLREQRLKEIWEATTKSHRYEPYPPCDSNVCKPPPSDKSFWNPSSKADGERLPPICLCCGNVGHTFPSCTSSTTPSGLSPHSKVANKQLVSRTTPEVKYCVDFNIYCNGKHTCSKHTHREGEIHGCSLCGSPDHGACSRKCLGNC